MTIRSTNRIVLSILLLIPLTLHYRPAEAVSKEDVRRAAELTARYGVEEKDGFLLWGLQAAETRYANGAGEALHRYALEKARFHLDKRRPRFHKNAMHCASTEGLVAVLLVLQSDDPVNAEYGGLEERLSRRVDRETEKYLHHFRSSLDRRRLTTGKGSIYTRSACPSLPAPSQIAAPQSRQGWVSPCIVSPRSSNMAACWNPMGMCLKLNDSPSHSDVPRRSDCPMAWARSFFPYGAREGSGRS